MHGLDCFSKESTTATGIDAVQEMKAFWLPSKTPEARQSMEKPDLETICPATGRKLALKSLISVKFNRLPPGEEGYAIDPVTKDVFSNASRLVVLKPTGECLMKRRGLHQSSMSRDSVLCFLTSR